MCLIRNHYVDTLFLTLQRPPQIRRFSVVMLLLWLTVIAERMLIFAGPPEKLDYSQRHFLTYQKTWLSHWVAHNLWWETKITSR